MTISTDDRLLTTEQAAHFLGVSTSFLAKARISAKPEIPHTKIGASVRYRRSDLEAFVSANLRRSTSDAA